MSLKLGSTSIGSLYLGSTKIAEAYLGSTKVYGAATLYQQASSQANPPQSHDATFYKCGSDTVTGAAELAQIPSDWKK